MHLDASPDRPSDDGIQLVARLIRAIRLIRLIRFIRLSWLRRLRRLRPVENIGIEVR
jgi:hypothetical protein